MPALASPSTWRSHPHSIDGYLYILNPTVVFQAKVNQASFTYPLGQLTYDTVTVGAYTDVRVGQTVKVTSSSGTFKGYTRVRLSPSSSVLFIGSDSDGEINFADNDNLYVLDDFRIWSRIPKINADKPLAVVFYKDFDLAYTNEGTYPPPVCNAGPHYAGFINPNTSVVTVTFDLTDSFAVADSATISSYAGSVRDGTVTSGSIASGIFTATFPAGKRWCNFTVTDSNGKTHTAYRFIAACERTGANAPLSHRVTNLRYAVDGAELSFSLHADDLSTDVVPLGTLAIYFEEETYNGAAGSLNGYSGCEHVKFAGWITDLSTSATGDNSDVTGTASGAAGVMRMLTAFSQAGEHKTTPTLWHHIKNLDLFKYIIYLLNWQTTALTVCDIERPSWYASYAYGRFDTDQTDAWSQVDNIAAYVNAKLSCDRNSIFYLRRDPMIMTTGDRAGVTTTVTLAASDWTNLQVSEKQFSQITWVRASGLLASRTEVTPYLSIAPGRAPAQGAAEETLDHQLVTNQTDLNVRCGNYFALKNSLKPGIELTILNGGTVVDPAWREFVVFSLTATTNKRELTYSSTRFAVASVEISIDIESGTSTEVWKMEEETSASAVDGVTLVVPTDKIADYTYSFPPPFIPDTHLTSDQRTLNGASTARVTGSVAGGGGRGSGTPAGDPASGWTADLDLTSSSHGVSFYSHPDNSDVCGEWISGTGIRTKFLIYTPANYYYRQINCSWYFGESTTLASTTMYYNLVVGYEHGGGISNGAGFEVDTWNPQVAIMLQDAVITGTAQTASWSGSILVTDRVSIYFNAGTRIGVDPGGEAVIYRMVFTGTGVNPFGYE